MQVEDFQGYGNLSGDDGDAVFAWVGDGAGHAEALPVPGVPGSYGDFLLADVDGDGLDDLVTTDVSMSPLRFPWEVAGPPWVSWPRRGGRPRCRRTRRLRGAHGR